MVINIIAVRALTPAAKQSHKKVHSTKMMYINIFSIFLIMEVQLTLETEHLAAFTFFFFF